MGARTFLIHDTSAASLRYSTSCSVLHQTTDLARADPAEVAEIINELHRRIPIDIVIGSDLDSLLLLARMGNLIVPPLYAMAPSETLLRLHDKWQFFQMCRALDIDVPRSVRIQPQTCDPGSIAREIGFPLVIKPTALYGQRGVVFVDDQRALAAEFRSYPFPWSIVQEFIPGQDWGISIFANYGRITNWTSFLCPDFVSAAFVPNGDLLELVRRIVAETHFNGVANFDARMDERDHRLKMFECNPRFFSRMSATRLCGLDFVKAGICGEERQALTSGYYFHWRELGRLAGWRALCNGNWKIRSLARDLGEMLVDPLPIVARKMCREDLGTPSDLISHPEVYRS